MYNYELSELSNVSTSSNYSKDDSFEEISKNEDFNPQDSFGHLISHIIWKDLELFQRVEKNNEIPPFIEPEEKQISKNTNNFMNFKENTKDYLPSKFSVFLKEDEKTNSFEKTKNSSDENEQNNIIIVPFNINKIQKRIDYSKNYFKKYLSKYLTIKANNIIQSSCLPIEYKQKIYLPNYRSFTGNPTERDNLQFLDFTIADIFGYYKKKVNRFHLQEKNKILINGILNFIEWSDGNDIKKYEEILSFFNNDLRTEIELFYKSKTFKEYANDPKTKIFEDEFQRQKHFSLLETNGFIKMVEQFKKI